MTESELPLRDVSKNERIQLMDYEIEKLKDELASLGFLWNKLKSEWEKPSDFEDIYRVYPFLTTTAAIARKYIHWNKNLDFSVRVIEPSFETDIDTSEYFYYDEKSFFNGINKDTPISRIAGLFLHQREYGYMDDRKSDGKMTGDVTIYVYAKSDVLCKSCSLVNNGEYKDNGNNYRKTTSFVGYSDCTCGLYINIDSYIETVNKIATKNKR